MNIIETAFDGVLVLEPKIWHDERGYFYESYNSNVLASKDVKITWVQDNEAKSTKGVLRGLHYQLPPYAQSKLVRVIQGEVLDVIVDVRPNSKTFGEHLTIILSHTNFKQLLIPAGFAHGYIVLSETAVFAYKCDNYYNKSSEGGIKYDDPHLGIDWILPKELHIISDKDLILPSLNDHQRFQ
jgi:dTDP-4-dehydrorhamnose 3,5-epimerase